MNYFGLLLVGLAAGVASGILGIGGGLIIVPALLYIFKMPILDATGTSLAALVPPVGLLAALEYYKTGHIQMISAGLIAFGLLIGGYFGAKAAVGLPPTTVHRVYGGFLLLVGARMLLGGK